VQKVLAGLPCPAFRLGTGHWKLTKLSNCPSPRRPNTKTSKEMLTSAFSCMFSGNCRCDPTSSKHPVLLHLLFLAQLFAAPHWQPKKSSNNCPSLHQPNMRTGKGMATNAFSCALVSNCKWVQTYSKHPVLPLAPLPFSAFRLLVAGNPWNCRTMSTKLSNNCPSLNQAKQKTQGDGATSILMCV
jgi:hypothetical protein